MRLAFVGSPLRSLTALSALSNRPLAGSPDSNFQVAPPSALRKSPCAPAGLAQTPPAAPGGPADSSPGGAPPAAPGKRLGGGGGLPEPPPREARGPPAPSRPGPPPRGGPVVSTPAVGGVVLMRGPKTVLPPGFVQIPGYLP